MATTVVWTDDGQEAIIDYYDTQTWYSGIGTGGTTAAVTDAALTTEVEGTRPSTTDSQPAADTFQMVGSHTIAAGPHTLDEAGVFTANTAGVMHFSATFDAVGVVDTDVFEATYQLQLKDSSE